MDVMTNVQEDKNSWLECVGLGAGVLVCLVLFGVVIVRMGLLNRVVGGEVTAVTRPNTILYTTKEMRFGQSELRVKAGEEITLQLVNYDLYAHSFDIDELDVHVQMPANGQASAQFTVSEPGEYKIYCGIPGHEEAGMVAKLIVEP